MKNTILRWGIILWLVLAVISAGALAGCSDEEKDTSAPSEPTGSPAGDTVALKPDGDNLTMYVAYGGPEIVARKFKEATGIKIEFLTMSSGEVLTRLKAEKSNPHTDIWFGGGSDAFIEAASLGLLEAYLSPNRERVAPAFRDDQGYWTGISLVVVGLLVNEDRLADKKLTLPETWEALADRQYKDELISSDPNISGTAYTTVSGILQIKGEEAGWAFLDQMYANIPYLEKSGSGPPKKVLAGEYAIGIVPDPHSSLISNPDAPLVAVFPEDGVLAWPSPVAIIAGAKHPNNARIFVDWCLSEEGQKVLMEASPRVPTTDVPTIEGVPNPSDLNLVAYDFVRWGNERDRVLMEFNRRYPQYQ